MKINKIKINSYGKLKEKELELKDNINIIYGENEAGKSTLLKFIINSLYGISKNKKGKEYSDYEKYLPWEREEFSGKLEYELDNKEKFEVYRDFKKKNPKIFNEKKEEITKQFNVDKNKGSEFFYEQTKVDEALFLSSVVVNQQEVTLQTQEQSILIQKIANLVGTGDDNVSFKRAIDRINRRQLEEIGTERSREKPINLISRETENLINERQELEKYEDIKYEIEENKNELQSEIKRLEKEFLILNEIKKINENEKIEQEKIKIKEKIKNENEEKIKNTKNRIEEIENNNKKIIEKEIEKNKKIKNKLNRKITIIFLLIILINIIQFIFIKNKLIKNIFLLTIPAYLIFSLFLIKNKNKKIKIKENNKKEEINIEKNNLKNEINILQKNNEELKEEINKLKNNFNLKINLEKEKIKNKYKNNIEKNKLEELLNTEKENLNSQKIYNLQNEINSKKIKLHTLNLDQENIEPKLENLSKIEEKIVNNNEKMLTLKNLEKSMNLAKETLSKCYEKMKNTVTPKFTQNLSDTISQITEGKYSNVIFNDETGLMVELKNGNYETVSKFSIGTIDQLYLSLRLSMVEELSEEKMPIILDEAFAYYDKKRLKNILKYINNRFKNNQIIILTCTEREKKILEELNIEFNLLQLNNT